jgi:hypothetical protein
MANSPSGCTSLLIERMEAEMYWLELAAKVWLIGACVGVVLTLIVGGAYLYLWITERRRKRDVRK